MSTKLNPVYKVPSHAALIEAVQAKVGGLLPRGIIELVAKYALERFDGSIFDARQWLTSYGAIPVTLPSLGELQTRVVQQVTATGKQTEKPVQKMDVVECANFVGETGRQEHPVPPDDLFVCLNTPVRPQDEQVAGFTCTVTYIPQFLRMFNKKVIAVTVRTLGLQIGPNPVQQDRASALQNPDSVLNNHVLEPQVVDGLQPSCYFMMEREAAPNTLGDAMAPGRISELGDKQWGLPEVRNFLAAIFSRRAWNGEYLYRTKSIYAKETAQSIYFVSMGRFEQNRACVEIARKFTTESGVAAARKFLPLPRS